MLASIWLQPAPPEEDALRGVIESVAGSHGTVPFRPHLTVCGGELDPARWDAALRYVRASRALPLNARPLRIAHLAESPFRAVFIEIENDAALERFRGELRAITRASELHPPHISLFYRIDRATQRPIEDMDEERLRAIAQECAGLLRLSAISLERPVIVTTEGSWENVRSWKVVREL